MKPPKEMGRKSNGGIKRADSRVEGPQSINRRSFIRMAGGAAAGSLMLPEWLRAAEGSRAPGEMGRAGVQGSQAGSARLVILHTNDTHSRIDPFPVDDGPFSGLGGVARRAKLIKQVREEHENVLLLDSGDIFQGTPYFNFFKGEIEFKAMSAMEYDVATIGNHDFDNGLAGLVEMMPWANFEFVSANYDVTGTVLEPHVRPWTIRDIGGVRVGIFGLGISFEGLVLAQLHGGVRYTDPFAAARRSVEELRAQGCSLVICLSHLGYRYRGNTPSDTLLAQEVEGIDLILGGHTHTFMDEPDVHVHPGGGRTMVNQVGWAGMRLGRVDVLFEPLGTPADGMSPHRPFDWAVAGYPIDSSLD